MFDKEKMLLELQSEFAILSDNFKELEKEYWTYVGDKNLWDANLAEAERARISNVFSRKFSRLFQNYLSSYASLFHHATVVAPNKFNGNFEKDVAKERAEFLKVPENSFIIDLRNIGIHRKQPVAGISFDMMSSFDEGVLKPCGITKHSPTLIVKELLELDPKRWSSSSKRFIMSCGKYVQIISLTELTFHNLRKLLIWTDNRIRLI